MKSLIVSLESFQKGEVPQEVISFISSCYRKVKEPFIVLDESSKIKTNNPCKESKKSKRTRAILQLGKLKADRCILTGTFMSKSPVNAYDQMNFLKPDFFPESMFAFAEHYTIRRSLPSVRGARVVISPKDYSDIRKRLLKYKDEPYAVAGSIDRVKSFYGVSEEDCRWIINHENYTPFKNIDELWRRIGDVCLHPKKEDILKGVPKTYKTYNLELTSEQRKLYLSLQNLHCTDHITVDNGLKLYLRFQDICNGYEPVEHVEYNENTDEEEKEVELVPLKENPKLDLLDELMEELGDEQVVIWCSRTRLLYDAKARLEAKEISCGVYDGKNKDREKNYDDFSSGKLQVLFLNQGSGAYGLDDLKKCNYAIYLCNDYSVEKREQSEDRIHRGIVKEFKYIIDLTFKGTCEDRVVEALKQGHELLSTGITDASLFNLEV